MIKILLAKHINDLLYKDTDEDLILEIWTMQCWLIDSKTDWKFSDGPLESPWFSVSIEDEEVATMFRLKFGV